MESTLFTCKGFDAGALKETGRAVVIVEVLVEHVEARVDAAVLLRDLSVVEVRGGRHGCLGEPEGRRPASEWGGAQEGQLAGGTGAGRRRRGGTQAPGVWRRGTGNFNQSNHWQNGNSF